MKFIKFNYLYSVFFVLFLAFFGCQKEDATSATLKNYVGLEPQKYVGLHVDETKTFVSKIYATEASNVDRTYALDIFYTTATNDVSTTLDAGAFSFPSTVTIPAGEKVGSFEISITGTDLGSGKDIVLSIQQVGGEDQNVSSFTEAVPSGAPIGTPPVVSAVKMGRIYYRVEELCDFNKVSLSITFDNYPEETAWELYDSSLNVISSGGIDAGGSITGYAALGFADKSTFATNFCLQSGEYTFVIYDDYGDGMYTSASNQGTYTVKFGDTVLATGTGDFGSSQATTFTLP